MYWTHLALKIIQAATDLRAEEDRLIQQMMGSLGLQQIELSTIEYV